MLTFRTEFEEECRKQFESDSKIGLLCSVAPDGYPHIALISSIGVKDSKNLFWGQFSQGLSKAYLKDNPKTGFLVVSPDQKWWTGKALHSGSAVKGEDFEYFNNKPLFRYNAYCGFGAVHYGKIVDVSAGEKLPLLKIALGFLRSSILKKYAPNNGQTAEQKMPPYGVDLASGLACLKFAAYVDTDGFPRLFPVMQGRPASNARVASNAGIVNNALVFAPSPYGDMMRQIPAGAKTAVFLANLDLESLLLQGRWSNIMQNSGGGFKGSVFEIDKVYNSMLPISGYIYPPKSLPNVYGKTGQKQNGT